MNAGTCNKVLRLAEGVVVVVTLGVSRRFTACQRRYYQPTLEQRARQCTSSKMHPTDPDDIEAGLRYEFTECDGGQQAGDVARASYFGLSVQGGDQEAGPTAVSLPLSLFK